MIDQAELTAYLKTYLRSKKFWFAVFTIVAGCTFLLLGSVHFVNGSKYHRSPVVDKISFGFSETFINTDQIMGTPAIVARAQYPLSILALQRAGFLETEVEQAKRVKEEQAKIEDEEQAKRAVQEYRAAMARIQATVNSREFSSVTHSVGVSGDAAKPMDATIPPMFDRRPIDFDAPLLEAIRQAVGKHPYSIFEIESVDRNLRASLGKDYRELTRRMDGPGSPIAREGDYYFGSACMAHNCPGNQGAFAIHAMTGSVVVGIEIERKIYVFGADTINKSPQQIRDWLSSIVR